MEESRTAAGNRCTILNLKRRECLSCFKQGFGYKKTATITGLNRYTVREYLRRYKSGDTKWSERGRKTESEERQ